MDSQDRTLSEIRDLLQRLLDEFELVYRDQLRLARERAEQSLGNKDSTKRQIYDLSDGRRSVGEIAKLLKTSQPNVSLHLKALVGAGLVSVQGKEGKRVYRKRWEV
jgi:DNA-binding transcriptional ArsR family regulator